MTAHQFMLLLRKLEKSYAKLLESTPSREVAERNCNVAFDNVIFALQDPLLRDLLNRLLQSASEEFASNGDKIIDSVESKKEAIMKEEAADAAAFGIKRNEILEVFRSFCKNRSRLPSFIDSVDELEGILQAHHRRTIDENMESMGLPRKKKKARRIDVKKASFNLLTGTAIIVANTKFAPTFVVSYALGGGAVLQAARDFIGDPID